MLVVHVLKAQSDPRFALEEARLAGNEMLRDLRLHKIEDFTLYNACENNRSLAYAEGMALGSYQFLKYYSHPEKKEKALRTIRFNTSAASAAEVLELHIVLEAVFLARDMVNEPHSHFNAHHLSEVVRDSAYRYGFSAEILDKDKIENLNMGGLLAVSRASSAPPKFCILEWKPADARNAKPLVLVGKGVVYDTGGLSLKPTEGMDYMKCDMAGAATVIGIFTAAARNRLPVHLVGLIPASDNLIGSNAILPGDVIRMHSGTTVEVLNTDAEGRLLLADALHYAKQYKPGLVLDLATLTGAAVRALGNQVICYMGTAGDDVKKDLEQSGWNTYERMVELPLWKEFGDDLKSNIADLRNVGSGNAGMITAGKFLEHFTDYPWLHLDIAGPAYLRTANGYRTKDGTGVGVRLLYDFLKNYATN
ncbi:MAG: leucyl aminopeptidase [Saprospiraceae bacterium]|nr:leucyl aminopeptidase [Saprospiraceae bacterium]